MGRGRRHAWLRRGLALALAVAPVFAAAAPGGAVTDGQIAAAQEQLDAARQTAHDAAVAYLRSEHELARVEERLAALERQLPRMRARVVEAHEDFDNNAVALYAGAGNGADVASGLFGASGAMDVGRATALASSSTEHARQSLDRLRAAQRALVQREHAVQDQRARQQTAVGEMKKQTIALQKAMRAAGKILRRLQAEKSVQDYLIAVAKQEAARKAAEAAAAAAKKPPPPAERDRSGIVDPDKAATVPVEDLICPVQAPVTFVNDWGQPRSGWRVHLGTDVFAARGSRNVAIADGVIVRHPNKLGGNAIWLEARDGHKYYSAHLESYAGHFNAKGRRRVKQGDLIGYSGNTGNAAGGPVHTHFEIHPGGGAAINPYPALREMCASQLGLDDAP
jgi:murein DD-endopeptidase MepM/ murein hydrolase activator NlpD